MYYPTCQLQQNTTRLIRDRHDRHLYPISFRQLGTQCAINENVQGALLLINPPRPYLYIFPVGRNSSKGLVHPW